MFAKVLWTGIAAGLSAAASLGARHVSSALWRLTAKEEPPARR